jgi:hypothetical protein
MTSPQPGVLFTGSYLTGNHNPGAIGPGHGGSKGPVSVFDTLANPPASGVASQTSGRQEEANLGVLNSNAYGAATQIMSKNVDAVKNFYDGAGVVGVNNNNPI